MPEKDIYNNIASNIGLEKFKIKEKKSNKLKNISQITLTSVLCMTSLTSMVFAKDISTKIYDNYFGTGEGVGTAIHNGYIEESRTQANSSETIAKNEITGKKIDGVDTKVKIDKFVMDDFTLSITFDVTLSNKIEDVVPINKVADMNFPDMLIYDENNVVLYTLEKNSLKEFCKEKSLNYEEYNLEGEKVINSGVNTYVDEKNGNHVKVVYNIYTGGDSYPKSKKINVFMKQIRISEDIEAQDGEEEILLQGNWDFSTNVPEKMYNRHNVIFKQTSTTNKDFNVESAVLYNTGTNIRLKFKAEKVKREYFNTPELEFYNSLQDNDELKTQEIWRYLENERYNSEEIREKESKSMEEYRNATNFDVYITNKTGEKFGITVGPRENGSKYLDEDGYMNFEGMFDLTKYNASDELILHVEYKGKNEKITLKKVEG